MLPSPFSALTAPWLKLQALALLALPLMLIRIPRKWDIKLPTWLSYAIYPAHLVVLIILEHIF